MQRFAAASGFLVLAFVVVSVDSSNSQGQRVQLAPRFVKGATLRYSIETNTTVDQHMTAPVVDSQDATQFKQSTSFVVRLDVLSLAAPTASGGSPADVRFRATFERSGSNSESNASSPAQSSFDIDIGKLQGRSFEFTLGAAGEPQAMKGLDELTSDAAAAQSAVGWIPVLANVGTFPQGGIEIGQKWNSEHPLSGFPLTDMVWRSESSYLRNDPCGSGLTSGEPAPVPDTCAVILTRFEILRHGSEHADASPEEYRRNGLRTSGKWTVSGESLNSISLTDGFLVSSTQTAEQNMDYEIVSAGSGSRIHQVGKTKTQTEINLIREAAQTAP